MIEPAVAPPGVGLRAAGASDSGRVRRNNEDRWYIDVERGIFLVVDGVGGHAAGEVAATVAVDTIVDRVERGGAPAESLVRQAITSANNEIHRLAQRSIEYAGMTCVVTLALVIDERLTVGHVGDSRLYKVNPRGFLKLTRDHSPVGEREDSREISEAEAMRHPRRNEVFRDVGSARHGPDDPEFIEVTSTTFEPDSAALLCTDGLTDMLSTAAIERLVRRHAGDPATVVQALLDAANDAGGRDNVTVVYVEGSDFSGVREASASTQAFHDSAGSESARSRPASQVARRAAWLMVGALLGIAMSAASLVMLDRLPRLGGPRVLVVGSDGGYASIGAAMAVAAASDVVQVEPGEYAESVVLDEGVQLAARVPGSVTLVAPSGRVDWISLTARGQGSRVSGIQIVGRPDAPIATGIQVDGNGLVVDDVAFEGNLDVGVDVRGGDAVVIRASRFSGIRGLAVRVGPFARPVLRHNVFQRGTDEHGPALHVQEGALPALDANLFLGYVDAIGAPAARRQQLLHGNYIIGGSDHGGR